MKRRGGPNLFLSPAAFGDWDIVRGGEKAAQAYDPWAIKEGAARGDVDYDPILKDLETGPVAASLLRKVRGNPFGHLMVYPFFRCPNRCVFCGEDQSMTEFAAHPLAMAELAAVLLAKRRQGIRSVTFSGGEPTNYPRFWMVLDMAKRLGYHTEIFTCGANLADPEFARRTLPFLDRALVTVQGHDPASQDPLTRRPGSFKRMDRALRNLDSAPRKVELRTNTVVVRRNLKDLPKIVDYVSGFRQVTQVWLSVAAPGGSMGRHWDEMAFRVEELMELVPELHRRARAKGKTLRLYNMLYCLVDSPDLVAELSMPLTLLVTRKLGQGGGPDGLGEEISPNPITDKVLLTKCRGCAYERKCGGVWKHYHEKFGDVWVPGIPRGGALPASAGPSVP
ncbi:MAG: radical SAM protein [Elusimicrobia bacterium]|nr:radical SAM protein [Elusimicrobiota bacterium]